MWAHLFSLSLSLSQCCLAKDSRASGLRRSLMAGAAATIDSRFAPLFLLLGGSSRRQQSWPHHSAPHSSGTVVLLGGGGPAAGSFNRFQIAELQCGCGHRRDVLLSCVMRANANADGNGGGVNSADAEDGQAEKNGLAALRQLDSQLRVLSQTDEARSSSRTSSLNGKPEEIQPGKDSGTPTVWPDFSEGFLAYAGVGLLLLTVINNVLYRIFFEPPVRPKVSQTISSELRMLRMRKLSGNLEAPPIAPNSK